MIIAKKYTRRRARHAALFFALTLMVLAFLFPGALTIPLRGQEEVSEELEREFSEYIAMPETLMYKMRAGEKGFVVVDLRGPEQFAGGHLRGAVNYPWKRGVFLSVYNRLPKNGEIFLMSEDGGFALEALRILVTAGFTAAYSVEGGMRNWPYTDLIERP